MNPIRCPFPLKSFPLNYYHTISRYESSMIFYDYLIQCKVRIPSRRKHFYSGDTLIYFGDTMTANKEMPKKRVTAKEFARRVGPRQAVLFIVLPAILFIVIFMIFRSIVSLMFENIDYRAQVYEDECVDAFTEFLSPGINMVNHTSYGIEDMRKAGQPNESLCSYLERQTNLIDDEFAEYTTGLYGFINDEYLDGSGWVPPEGYDPQSRPWYSEALSAGGNLVFVSPYIDTMTGETTVTITKALSDGVSVVAMDIQVDSLIDIALELKEASDQWHSYIILDNDGTVILHEDTAMIGQNALTVSDQTLNAIAEEVLTKHTEDTFNLDHINSNYIYLPAVMDGGWHLVIVCKTSEYMRDIYRIISSTVTLAIIGLIIIIVFLVLFTSRKIISEDYNSDLHAISGIYDSVHKINLKNNTYEIIKALPSKTAAKLATDASDVSESFKRVVEFMTYDSFREEMLEFTDLSTLEMRMGDSDSITNEYKDRIGKWCRARFIVDEREEDGTIRSVLWAVENIDKERRTRERLQYLSETDGLTGILNRSSGEHKVIKELQTDDGGMFIMLDIDRFKSINDNYGHDVGDQVIIAVAECMQSTFRGNDIVFRLGGDEFAAFMPGVYDRESGGLIISRLMESINNITIEGHDDLKVDVSIGVTFRKPCEPITFDDLYKKADKCAYESKSYAGTHVSY